MGTKMGTTKIRVAPPVAQRICCKIAELFAIHGPVIPDFGPSWNVAPQTFQTIVRQNRDTGERETVLMRWGLIPYCLLGEGPDDRAP
jgi:putative SOS response-associated peptidase YedK